MNEPYAATPTTQTSLIARQEQLDSLLGAFDQVRQNRGQLILIVGDNGIGKSRLLDEFLRLCPSADGLRLRASCPARPSAGPFEPVVRMLNAYFSVSAGENPRNRRSLISNKALALDRTLEDTLPYLFGLLGASEDAQSIAPMDAQVRRQRTLDAVVRLILRESREHPTILAFEDIHWIDGATQGLLDHLAERLHEQQVLLIATCRPSYRQTWSGKRYYRGVSLEALSPADALTLTASFFDNASSETDRAVQRAVADCCAGNPLFIEEALNSLAAEGVLEGKLGSYRAKGRSAAEISAVLHIPTSIEDCLAGRIDRLPPEERALLQSLSVLGRPFDEVLAAQLIDRHGSSLSEAISRLEAAGLLRRTPDTEAAVYEIRHPLYADAAYRSALPETRVALHRAAAAALERVAGTAARDYDFELASHHDSAGDRAKAVEYSLFAGQQAIRRASYDEAIARFSRGIELLAESTEGAHRDQQELMLQAELGSALIGTRGWASSEVERALSRACELCRRHGDPSRLFAALWGLAVLYFVRGQMKRARALENELLEVARESGEVALRLQVERLIGFNQTFLGELEGANERFDETIRLFNPDQHGWLLSAYPLHPTVVARMVKGLNLWYLGFPDQALAVSSEAIWIAEDAADPFSLVNATLYVAFVLFARGDIDEAIAMTESGAALAEEHGFREYRAYGAAQVGQGALHQGRIGEGISRLRQAIAALGAMGVRFIVDYWLILLAQAHGMQGTPERGLELIAETERAIEETSIRLNQSRLYRVKGELLAAAGAAPSESEGCYQRALEVARRQKSKSYELEAAARLARLWRDQGMAAQARELVSATYGWFREGFDTAPLKDARILLEELS